MASGVIDSVEIKSEDGTAIGYRSTGEGPGIVVVPGMFRAARHYHELATALADGLTVHTMDRRGRGMSGPQGDDYDIDRECADLIAVMENTGATMVFGHCFGGLVALETVLRRWDAQVTRLALYEPTISLGGAIATNWLPAFDRALSDGRTADAVTSMMIGLDLAGGARRMPLRLRQFLTRRSLRGERMADAVALLPTVHAEVNVVRALKSTGARYTKVETGTLLLSGGRSPHYLGDVSHMLHAAIHGATLTTLPKASHAGPDQEEPRQVAEHLRGFFATPKPE